MRRFSAVVTVILLGMFASVLFASAEGNIAVTDSVSENAWVDFLETTWRARRLFRLARSEAKLGRNATTLIDACAKELTYAHGLFERVEESVKSIQTAGRVNRDDWASLAVFLVLCMVFLYVYRIEEVNQPT